MTLESFLMTSPILVPTLVLPNTAHPGFKQCVTFGCPAHLRDDSELIDHGMTIAAQMMFTNFAKEDFVEASAHNEPAA